MDQWLYLVYHFLVSYCISLSGKDFHSSPLYLDTKHKADNDSTSESTKKQKLSNVDMTEADQEGSVQSRPDDDQSQK